MEKKLLGENQELLTKAEYRKTSVFRVGKSNSGNSVHKPMRMVWSDGQTKPVWETLWAAVTCVMSQNGGTALPYAQDLLPEIQPGPWGFLHKQTGYTH